MLSDVELDGTKLRELRRQRKMTGIELAAKVGIGNHHLSKIENGLAHASPKLIERLAKVFDVPPKDLCKAPGQVEPPPGASDILILDLWHRLVVTEQTQLIGLGEAMIRVRGLAGLHGREEADKTTLEELGAISERDLAKGRDGLRPKKKSGTSE